MPEQRTDFYRRLEERLGALAGVTSVTVVSHLPLSGATERRLEVGGRTPGAGDALPSVWTLAIGPRYFETLGVALTRGRAFAENDGNAGEERAIVNERFVEMFFGEENPIGRRIALVAANTREPKPAWLTIIAVSPAIRQRPVPDPDPVVYLPYRAAPPATAALLVRSRNDPGSTVSQLRDEVLALDPHLPLYRTMTMAQVFDDAQWNRRVSSRLVYTRDRRGSRSVGKIRGGPDRQRRRPVPADWSLCTTRGPWALADSETSRRVPRVGHAVVQAS